jgi:hypothetical protein
LSYLEQTQPKATQIVMPEHISSEPSNVHLYVPKANQGEEAYTSFHPRVQLPWVPCDAVRNLATVATLESTHTVSRQGALAQIRTMAATGDESAITMAEALKDYKIEDDTPFDPSIARVRTGGGWKRA